MEIHRDGEILENEEKSSNKGAQSKTGRVCDERGRKKLHSPGGKKGLRFPHLPLAALVVVIHLAAFFSMFNDGKPDQ